ncbi:MAG TPA: ion channel, partial [Kofleriaceae bacterium]
MSIPPGARKYNSQGSTVYVVGEKKEWLRDAYHSFLRLPWGAAFAVIAIGFFVFNLGFACVYLEVGGIAGATGSFTDALSFSVQTMATIGYGVMHPTSGPANGAMIIESMFGIVFTALTTGLVFAKFSRPTTRVRFTSNVCITNFEGERTAMFRIGNMRSNLIVEATVHAVVMKTTITAEGEKFFKAYDLKLVRDRQVGMTRGWVVMHTVDETSPLYGMDEEALLKNEVEMYVALTGIDSVTAQNVHAMQQYLEGSIKVGFRFEDTLRELPGGELVIDLDKFDVIVPDTQPRAVAHHVSV